MKKQPKDSSALHLIRHVWDHNREGTGFSWTRLNGSMHSAVKLAIKAGLKFDIGDFKYMAENFRIGYWGGNNGHMCGENFYSCAVQFDHISACQSFEAWKQRKPFTWEDTRIHIGSRFSWKGEAVDCTSFSADGTYFIATAYKEQRVDKDGYTRGPRKPKYVFRISDADLRAARKAAKAHLESCKQKESSARTGESTLP